MAPREGQGQVEDKRGEIGGGVVLTFDPGSIGDEFVGGHEAEVDVFKGVKHFEGALRIHVRSASHPIWSYKTCNRGYKRCNRSKKSKKIARERLEAAGMQGRWSKRTSSSPSHSITASVC
jgi:hypothetical protein